MKIDRKRLKDDIHEDRDILRTLKSRLRTTGYQMTTQDSRTLVTAKKTATIHCSIMAHARGRLHLTKRWSEKDKCFYPLSIEDQIELIGEEMKKYLIPDELDSLIAEEIAKKETQAKSA